MKASTLPASQVRREVRNRSMHSVHVFSRGVEPSLGDQNSHLQCRDAHSPGVGGRCWVASRMAPHVWSRPQSPHLSSGLFDHGTSIFLGGEEPHGHRHRCLWPQEATACREVTSASLPPAPQAGPPSLCTGLLGAVLGATGQRSGALQVSPLSLGECGRAQ